MSGPTLIEMLECTAARLGDSRAYTFLADGEREAGSRSWATIGCEARAVAAALQSLRIPPGERALLLYPPGLDFIPAFFGALHAGVIAVPCFPPHPSQLARSLPRLLSIVADAEPTVVLTTRALAGMADAVGDVIPALAAAAWVATDDLAPGLASSWRHPGLDAGTIAFLQYTSGSTASPRGVMVTHGNLIHNLSYARHVEENDASSISVSWLPVIHDMGLIEGVLQPAFAGYPAYLMAPTAFLQRPVRWLRAITSYAATNSGGPNFAYDLCLRKITDEQLETLDLSSWRVAYNGAEPIRAETLTAFHSRFAGRGFRWSSFYPVYGLAEATLVVSSGRRDYEPVLLDVDGPALSRGSVEPPHNGTATTVVSSGPVGFGVCAAIVDPETHRRRPCGSVGEIWLSSPSVARGYWGRGRASQTAEVFHAGIRGEPGKRWLRSGDLGFVDDKGELFVTGRLKDLLIIRGVNHYPQDIERTVERVHPAIRPASVAAFAVAGELGECVGVMAEVDLGRGATRVADPAVMLAEVIVQLRQGIGEEHGVPVAMIVLVPPGALPKTSSGKVRRHAAAIAAREHSVVALGRWEPSTQVSSSQHVTPTAVLA